MYDTEQAEAENEWYERWMETTHCPRHLDPVMPNGCAGCEAETDTEPVKSAMAIYFWFREQGLVV